MLTETPSDNPALEEAAESASVGASSLLPDPRALFAILWRRLWIFLLVVAAVIGAVVAYVTITPKTYTAVAAVQIEPRRGDPVQSRDFAAPEQAPASDFIDTQILVIDSPQVAAGVVRALKLTEDPQFNAGMPPGDPSDPQVEQARVIAATQPLRNASVVRRAGATSIIEIAVTSRSPVQAARIANEYARQYLIAIDNSKEQATKEASVKVDSRLDSLRQAAEQADAALQQYKIAHGLMSAQGATMAEQENSTLNQQIAAARAELAQRQGRLDAARKQLARGGGGDDVTSALASGTIGALRQQEADSSRTLAQLHQRYGDKHPAIAQEEQRLADVRRQIQAEIDRIISSLQAEVNVAASGLASLTASQDQARGRLASNSAAQVGFLELERKSNAARTVYESFLARSKGTAARDGIEQPTATFSSEATIPNSPSAPNITLAYLLGLIFALVAGLVAVAVVEFLDGGVSKRSDIERRLGARYLGAVPDLDSTLDGMRATENPEDYIVAHPMSAFAEALRSLRTSVTLRGNRRPRVIAITSALPREGKTTTAVALARTLAMSGSSTVIVDCDLRRRSSSQILLGDRRGLLPDVLLGKTPVAEAFLPDPDTGLMILGASETPSDGRDLLAPDLVGQLLADLRERFDYVILDTAPVLGIADARAVAVEADAVVLLARWRRTSLRAVDSALDLLLDGRAKVFGVALTQVNIRKFGSVGAEDLYGYHKKFKGYYAN